MMTRDQKHSEENAIGFTLHDHADCKSGAMATAEKYCAEHKLHFTPVRRRVLEILLQEHSALGAYDILERLSAEGHGAQPPVAYRALEFLVTNGFAHKIERMNAFVACAHPGQAHAPAFMICRSCDKVAEAPTALLHGRLGAAAQAAGFLIERTVVEAEGLCPSCQKKTPT